MNALFDLIGAEESPSVSDLRTATTASLHALRHDKRVRELDMAQVQALTRQLVQTADLRTLVRLTTPYTPELVAEGLEYDEATSFEHQMLFDVVDWASLDDPEYTRLQQVVVSRGSQIRVAHVPFRANIYDRRAALVARDFDDNVAGAILVEEPGLVAGLVELHARLFRSGARWEPGRAAARGVDVDLSDVLAHLLEGHTDETAARSLGVSLRTYRRRVQDLLTLLGTQSRFQAGVLAHERRYVDLVRPTSWPESAPPDPLAYRLNGLAPPSE